MSLYLPQEPFLSPKATVVETELGFAIYSLTQIEKLELVAVFGGKIITAEELQELSEEEKCMTMQVGEDEFSFSVDRHVTDYVNHSCDPNLGFDSNGNLRAMGNVEPYMELTFDYSMADSVAFDEFECLCASAICRKSITGDDWQIPDLQKRYKGWFMPYLQAKIDNQTATSPKL